MVLREQPLCRENDGRPNRLARRTLLRRGFYSVLAGTLAAPLLPASRALAGTKVAKSDAEYKDSPRGSMRCDSCLWTSGGILLDNNNASCGLGGNAWAQVASYWFNTVSGRAEKTDIAPLRDTLAAVRALQPVNFHWREEGTLIHDERVERRLHAGFIADEVAAVLGQDFGGYTNRDGHEGIAHSELTAVLWRAVQTLADELETLKRRMIQ